MTAEIVTLAQVPKTGFAHLRSYNLDGTQRVALRYKLDARGERQALIRYYEFEVAQGRDALIDFELEPVSDARA